MTSRGIVLHHTVWKGGLQCNGTHAGLFCALIIMHFAVGVNVGVTVSLQEIEHCDMTGYITA